MDCDVKWWQSFNIAALPSTKENFQSINSSTPKVYQLYMMPPKSDSYMHSLFQQCKITTRIQISNLCAPTLSNKEVPQFSSLLRHPW
jgi:hypothetical protein